MGKRKIECEMYLTAETSIDGLNVWCYEVESQLGEFFVVEYEREDKQLTTEIRTDRAAAKKLYNRQVKKMLAKN